MLDQLGLGSMQTETAKDALELLADARVDVLFTDIELPGGMSPAKHTVACSSGGVGGVDRHLPGGLASLGGQFFR